MKKIELTVRFTTPAFLGNAEQEGQWRTPPFKALIRQWWRVAMAKRFNYDHTKLREAEGRLFGHAWLKHTKPNGKEQTWAMRGRVLVKIGVWKEGQKKEWERADPTIDHPEVGRRIGSHLYLGYGPLTNNKERKNNPNLPATIFSETENGGRRSAIDCNDSVTLTIVCPENHREDLLKTLQLMNLFGTVGSRSRNGWGSFSIAPSTGPSVEMRSWEDPSSGFLRDGLFPYSRPITECLGEDWPHAIGTSNNHLLVWRTRRFFKNWQEAMKHLAEIKIKFRTSLSIENNREMDKLVLDERHILGYPVTNHGVVGWGQKKYNEKNQKEYFSQDERLGNQLRFKVVQNKNGQYLGIAYHLPCKVSTELTAKNGVQDPHGVLQKQQVLWSTVHGVLDRSMTSIG